MFVLDLTYTAPLDAVDAALDAHVAWLEEQYAAGVFLASGRKNPRDGGVILAVAQDRARIEEIVAGDPFVTAGVCAYRVTEFVATKTAAGLERYRETLG
ncbi:YciI family protein [Streptomyces sp. NPDC058255]|uniref:YciI family protein n=1 Tax=Streptomyces sp. NPDC058255 TaxID=3346407 RepID=UPI0036E99C0A